jgi:hypothetical protein
MHDGDRGVDVLPTSILIHAARETMDPRFLPLADARSLP